MVPVPVSKNASSKESNPLRSLTRPFKHNPYYQDKRGSIRTFLKLLLVSYENCFIRFFFFFFLQIITVILACNNILHFCLNKE